VSDDEAFADLLRRVRAGDPQAAEELVRQYEPALRLELRLRLSDPRLRRRFGASDVCQAVLLSFFVRAAAGQYELRGPGDLVRLLAAMARRKLAFQARRERAPPRDYRRTEPLAGAGPAAAPGPSPSWQAEAADLLRAFRRRLSAEERALAELRARGLGWAEVAAELGGTPEGRRKQLARAVQRVSRELGLDEVGGA
jgi:RNA polymerase sigma-70 factor (ECF subfamily)